MQYLEQFYEIRKNSRTSLYARIFSFSGNYSIYQPKTDFCKGFERYMGLVPFSCLKLILQIKQLRGAKLRFCFK